MVETRAFNDSLLFNLVIAGLGDGYTLVSNKTKIGFTLCAIESILVGFALVDIKYAVVSIQVHANEH